MNEKENMIFQTVRKKIQLDLLVIFLFIGFTSLVTFPVIENFSLEFAGTGGDTWQYLWNFWWNHQSEQLNLDNMRTQHIFYPNEITVIPISPLLSTVASFLNPFLSNILIWNSIWFFGFVIAGYGMFCLSRYLKQNFIGSISAGLIFTFSSFHLGHGLGHLDLASIFWIPFCILFIFKILESKKFFNIPICGLLIFFTIITSWYIGLMIIVVSLLIFSIKIFQEKKLSKKKIFFNFLITYIITIILTMIVIYPIIDIVNSNESFGRSLNEFEVNSLDPVNIFIPSSLFTFPKLLNISTVNPQIEQSGYLGITAIALSIFGLIRNRDEKYFIWLAILAIFSILSFGPELKVAGVKTGIILPIRVFYDFIPGLDMFRVSNRFSLMMIFSIAMLASSSISKLTSSKRNKQNIILGVIILSLIVFEISSISYPTTSSTTPEIYNEIKNDVSQTVLLETPIGGSGQIGLLSDPIYLLYQTIHEKPIFGGYYSRIPTDIQRSVQTYFLNQFVWYSEIDDIVKQDLNKVGISIFNHYNVGYVLIHKQTEWYWLQDHITDQFIPNTKNIMKVILDKDTPYFEDGKIVVYKIPESKNFDNFILLGDGWRQIERDDGIPYRTTTNSELIIVNPTNSTSKVNLKINLEPIIDSNISLTLREEIIFEKVIDENLEIYLEDLETLPGINKIIIKSDSHILKSDLNEEDKKYKSSIKVKEITLK